MTPGGPRRFHEQKWLLDAVVGLEGLDWDELRQGNTIGAAGPDALPHYLEVARNVERFDEFGPAFAAAADDQASRAKRLEEQGNLVAARESFFTAAAFYGWAQWPIYEHGSARNAELNAAKVACYTSYAALSDHHVERIELSLDGKLLPAWLHLPPTGSPPYPTVILIPGMDTYKEIQVAMYGDKFLQRGFAILAVDGPGQSEAVAGGLLLTPRNFVDAGAVWLDWIDSRPDLDSDRVGIYARSFGSYAATVLASEHAERLRAVCVALVIHEPGLYSLMETSTPSYKARFMYMTGHENEEEFDQYVTGFDVREHAERISCPYLVVAGQLDELSPIEHTYRLLDIVPSPRELVVYEGERHAIGRGPASRKGPHWHSLAADWLRRRVIDQQPAQSKSLLVKRSGAVAPDPRGFND